jgi:hypothetical protein
MLLRALLPHGELDRRRVDAAPCVLQGHQMKQHRTGMSRSRAPAHLKDVYRTAPRAWPRPRHAWVAECGVWPAATMGWRSEMPRRGRGPPSSWSPFGALPGCFADEGCLSRWRHRDDASRGYVGLRFIRPGRGCLNQGPRSLASTSRGAAAQTPLGSLES